MMAPMIPATILLGVMAVGRVFYCIKVDQTALGRALDLALVAIYAWAIWCLWSIGR